MSKFVVSVKAMRPGGFPRSLAVLGILSGTLGIIVEAFRPPLFAATLEG